MRVRERVLTLLPPVGELRVVPVFVVVVVDVLFLLLRIERNLRWVALRVVELFVAVGEASITSESLCYFENIKVTRVENI